jgi:hypothetical protein
MPFHPATDLSEVTVVTAGDEAFADLLRGMLSSLRHWHPDLPVTLLDLGLTAATRQDLERRFKVRLVEPDWHMDPAIVSHWSLEPWWRALTVRPHLPSYIDSAYIQWVDADICLMGPEALGTYHAAARRPGIAFVGVPQLDRNYRNMLWTNGVQSFLRVHDGFRSFTDPERALTYSAAPMINGGCFQIPADSPLWAAWDRIMAELFAATTKANNGMAPLLEQMAMNEALEALPSERIALLPARFNWIVGNAVPVIDTEAGRLVEPDPPHDPIAVVHLIHGSFTAEDKATPLATRTLAGEPLETALTWDAIAPRLGLV